VLEIILAQEADEDAVAAVVSGDAGNHGDFDARLLLVRAADGTDRVIVSARC
jgi:hypothetical protein